MFHIKNVKWPCLVCRYFAKKFNMILMSLFSKYPDLKGNEDDSVSFMDVSRLKQISLFKGDSKSSISYAS